MKILRKIKKWFEYTPVEVKPFIEFRNIATNKAIFTDNAFYFKPYIPSNGTVIRRSGYMWKVIKTYANYDADPEIEAPIIIWLKEIPDD